jgi:hypothetical protein
VQDNEWHQYAQLADYLGGRGVPSIEEALKEVFLRPIHGPFRELVNAGHLRWLVDNRIVEPDGQLDPDVAEEAERRTLALLREIKQFAGSAGNEEAITLEICRKLEACIKLPVLAERFPLPHSRKYMAAVEMVQTHMDDDLAAWGSLLGWLFTHALGKSAGGEGFATQSRSWIDEWLLGKIMAGALQDMDLDEGAAWQAVDTVKILINHQDWRSLETPGKERVHQVLISWLSDGEVQDLVQVNRYGGMLWFNHEAFGQLLAWMLTLAAVEISADPALTPEEVAQEIVACYDIVHALQQAEKASEYQVVKLIEAAKA